MTKKICKYELVEAYECPYCGALVLIEDAGETCWSCDEEVAYPDDPGEDE
jgi:rubrerythrin